MNEDLFLYYLIINPMKYFLVAILIAFIAAVS